MNAATRRTLWAVPVAGLAAWATPRAVRVARSVRILERVDAGSLWDFEDKEGKPAEIRTGDQIAE